MTYSSSLSIREKILAVITTVLTLFLLFAAWLLQGSMNERQKWIWVIVFTGCVLLKVTTMIGSFIYGCLNFVFHYIFGEDPPEKKERQVKKRRYCKKVSQGTQAFDGDYDDDDSCLFISTPPISNQFKSKASPPTPPSTKRRSASTKSYASPSPNKRIARLAAKERAKMAMQPDKIKVEHVKRKKKLEK